MNETMRLKVLKGRASVEAYREAHRQLHAQEWHRGIPEKHTPLLNRMLAELNIQGFNSIDEFFDRSQELNISELGFASRADFEARASEADSEALDRMWR